MIGGYKITALCLSRIHDTSSHAFVKSLNEQLTQNHERLFVYSICSDLYWKDQGTTGEASVFRLIDFTQIDSLIIMEEKIKDKAVTAYLAEQALQHQIPVVVINGAYPGCINLSFDFESGFREVVRHVIDAHHCKRPHFMAGYENNPFSDARMQVFKEVLAEHGMPCDESTISYGNFWSEPAQQATEVLLQREVIPDAIICANDIMGINVCFTLQSHGLRVPEDVIVTGFDGIYEIYSAVPKLTSSLCSYTDMAETTLALLTQAAAGEAVAGNYLVEPQLMRLESCGCEEPSEIPLEEYMNAMNEAFYRFQDENRILSTVTDSVQICENIQEAANKLNCHVIFDLCCILNPFCIDECKHVFDGKAKTDFDDMMYLFYNTDAPKPFVPHAFPRKQIIPDLGKHLAQPYPLLFNVLDSMDVVLGYVCFFFQDYSILSYGKMPHILGALSHALWGMKNFRHQRFLAEKVESLYKYDTLTGLYNRTGFSKAYDKLIGKYKDRACTLTIIFSDLDGLKYINDHFGHAAGDHAIHTVASAFIHACPETALCLRFGGDEMLAVIADLHEPDEIISQIDRYIEICNANADLPYQISASIGAYQTALTSSLDFEHLINKADELMYLKKSKKKHKQNRL